jgi:hypoxanthine phosphoribosyltransferase
VLDVSVESLKTIILGAIGSLIAAVVVWYMRHKLRDIVHKVQTWTLVLRGLIVLLLLGAVFVQVYHILSLPVPDVSRQPAFRIAVSALLAQFVLGCFLYFVIKTQRRQFRRPFLVQPISDPDPIKISQLKQPDNQRDKRLELSWETFGHGIAVLEEQIRTSYNVYTPDMCIGVNPSGLLVASHLSARIWSTLIPVGYVVITRVGGYPRLVHESLPDSVQRAKSILVADSEIKSGDSLKYVERFLREEKGCAENVEIKFAVLWACMVRGKIENMAQLRLKCNENRACKACLDNRECKECKGVFTQSDEYLPDYLAFVTPGRVWKPGRIH